jgi:hypothetical protein
MDRYMPLTGIDLIPASLLIDTQAPLDVLHARADYRIRTVTQVLESIAFRAEIGCDTVVLSDFPKLLAIPLRDGCDFMDVIGRRLRAQTAELMKMGDLLVACFMGNTKTNNSERDQPDRKCSLTSCASASTIDLGPSIISPIYVSDSMVITASPSLTRAVSSS